MALAVGDALYAKTWRFIHSINTIAQGALQQFEVWRLSFTAIRKTKKFMRETFNPKQDERFRALHEKLKHDDHVLLKACPNVDFQTPTQRYLRPRHPY